MAKKISRDTAWWQKKHGEALAVLEQLALLAQLAGENAFKAQAFARGARVLAPLVEPFGKVYESGELQRTAGIGKGLFAVIQQVVEGQPVTELKRLRAAIPDGVLAMVKLPGLGPGRARRLWRELGITTLGELEYACGENRLTTLRGFGPKLQAQITQAIAYSKRQAGKLRLDQALAIAEKHVATLRAHKEIIHADIAGDIRRRCETVTRMELVIQADWKNQTEAGQRLSACLGKQGLVTVPGNGGLHPFYVVFLPVFEDPEPPIVAYCCEPGACFFAFRLFATGAEAFLTAFEKRARAKKMTFTPTGLMRGGSQVPVQSEEDLFALLDLHPTPPEQREQKPPCLVERAKPSPRLVRRGDLRGAFHNHTTASDGKHTPRQMRAAAIEQGLTYLGISDHSQSAAYVSGLSSDRLLQQVDEIRRLNEEDEAARCFLFAGTESDILAEGELDYPAEVLEKLDFVVASVHSRLRQDRTAMTHRMMQAARNPYTTCLGHPTGRLILARPPSDYHMRRVLDVCAESGCWVELNANPHRLDLNERHLAMARERGIPIAINADAHHVDGLRDLQYGVWIARRAGLRAEDVINCLALAEIRVKLQESRQRQGPRMKESEDCRC
ncbi:MAG: PHP domain-containing protein [Myxococcota bacterium]